jgi:hypothetical protein
MPTILPAASAAGALIVLLNIYHPCQGFLTSLRPDRSAGQNNTPFYHVYAYT